MKKLTILFFVASFFCLSGCEKNGGTNFDPKKAVTVLDGVMGMQLNDANSKIVNWGIPIEEKLYLETSFYDKKTECAAYLECDYTDAIVTSAEFRGKEVLYSKEEVIDCFAFWVRQIGISYEGKHQFHFSYATTSNNPGSYDTRYNDYESLEELINNAASINFLRVYYEGEINVCLTCYDRANSFSVEMYQD